MEAYTDDTQRLDNAYVLLYRTGVAESTKIAFRSSKTIAELYQGWQAVGFVIANDTTLVPVHSIITLERVEGV